MNDDYGLNARFLSDKEAIIVFGITNTELKTLKIQRDFPRYHPLMKKTDRLAVHRYFDNESGIGQLSVSKLNGKENFS